MTGIPGWVGPTIAISLAIIALAILGTAVGAFLLARKAVDQSQGLAKELAELRQEIRPTVEAVNRLATTGSEVGGRVRDEALALVDTSRRLRRSLLHGARRVRGRLEDLDALYEVVHGEVQETALDVAATLRSVRTGASALTRIKRLITRARR
jgi:ABC-type transporter Mla subunit MlaD